jgi:hypothetical protein
MRECFRQMQRTFPVASRHSLPVAAMRFAGRETRWGGCLTTHHITSLNEHGTKTAKFHMYSLPYLYLGEQPGAVADEGSGDGAQRAEHLLQLGPVGTVVRVLARSPNASTVRTNNYCCKLDQFRFRCLVKSSAIYIAFCYSTC